MSETGTSWFDWSHLERDRVRVARGFWPKVKRTLGYVPFVDDAVAAYYCTRDPETPIYVKAVLFGALAYFVMPADMIPDFLAVFGYSDDAAVLATALRTVAPAIKDHHRAQARAALRPDG
ncbi:MAG: YkvA family protein [Pseudomonadota bacterium]